MIEDWQGKVLLGLIPVAIAGGGWVMSLESRLQVIDARQQERTIRFDNLERQMLIINSEVMDPKPKPETRVQLQGVVQDIERLRDELQRINERVNNLHAYFMQVVPRPPFNPQKDGRRGEVFELYPQRQL